MKFSRKVVSPSTTRLLLHLSSLLYEHPKEFNFALSTYVLSDMASESVDMLSKVIHFAKSTSFMALRPILQLYTNGLALSKLQQEIRPQ